MNNELIHNENPCEHCGFGSSCFGKILNAHKLACAAGTVVERRRIPRGKPLYEKGQPFTDLFILASGSCKAVTPWNDMKNRIVGISLRGDLIGFSGVDKGVYEETVIALENAVFCAIPYQSLMQMIPQDRALNRRFHEAVGLALHQQHEAAHFVKGGNAQTLVIGFLIWFSSQLSRRSLRDTEFTLPVTRKDLAGYIGLQLETVSRVFSRLAKMQLVESRGRHIRIANLQALHNLFKTEPA